MQMASDWQNHFQHVVETLSPQGDPLVHRFWMLFIGGASYGEGSWFWLHSFKQLHILHLLVLSGSQVEGVSKWVRSVVGWFLNVLPLSAGLANAHALFLRVFLSSVLLGFGFATGWSAPIARATILSFLGMWLVRVAKFELLLAGFFIHWGIFDEHREQMGFYLSWISYLAVIVAGEWKVSKYLAILLVSGVLYWLVDVLYFERPFHVMALLQCLAANLFFCAIFDWVLMPLGAVMILFCLVLTALSYWNLECPACGDFLALWTRPLGEALLVVLKRLMYT